mmetsp:Transcript_8190/g.15148  ORF Transcript_8190/g.15148 Transcript_8190/m.15148 type:complete len:397 (-) Transcript_8190:2451-3641(-)
MSSSTQQGESVGAKDALGHGSSKGDRCDLFLGERTDLLVSKLEALLVHIRKQVAKLGSVCEQYEESIEAKERVQRIDRMDETLRQRAKKREEERRLAQVLEMAREIRAKEKEEGTTAKPKKKNQKKRESAFRAVEKVDTPPAEVDQEFAPPTRPNNYKALRKQLLQEAAALKTAKLNFMRSVKDHLESKGMFRLDRFQDSSFEKTDEDTLVHKEAMCLANFVETIFVRDQSSPPATDVHSILQALFPKWYRMNLLLERVDAVRERAVLVQDKTARLGTAEHLLYYEKWKKQLVDGGKQSFKSKRVPIDVDKKYMAQYKVDLSRLVGREVYAWSIHWLRNEAEHLVQNAPGSRKEIERFFKVYRLTTQATQFMRASKRPVLYRRRGEEKISLKLGRD